MKGVKPTHYVMQLYCQPQIYLYFILGSERSCVCKQHDNIWKKEEMIQLFVEDGENNVHSAK